MKEFWSFGTGICLILTAIVIVTGYFTFSEFIHFLQVEGMLIPIVFIFGFVYLFSFWQWFEMNK